MNLDTRDHGYWRNVARILGIGLIGWTYRERATFSDGLLLNQNAADVLIKQYAEIERLKEEIWRLRWPTITTNDATAHLWIEKDAEIERLTEAFNLSIKEGSDAIKDAEIERLKVKVTELCEVNMTRERAWEEHGEKLMARNEFLEKVAEQATRKMETRKHTGEIVVASYCDNPCVTVGWVDSEPELAAWLKEKENAS